MKTNKDHLQDWGRVENKWREQLANHEEQLPDGLWEKLEGRSKNEEGRSKNEEGRSKNEEGSGRKGEVQSAKSAKSAKSVVLVRWSAAAAVLLLLFFWISFEREEGLELKVESGKLKVESGKLKVEKTVPELVEGGALKVENVNKFIRSKKSHVMNYSEPLIESVAQVSVKNELPVEVVKYEKSAETAKSTETAKSVESVESVKSVVQTEVDEMLVVVDVVPVKKAKVLNKVFGFLKKVKSGKILDLTTKSREGKLNDGIHQVLYQIEEKEEKFKNLMSL